MNSRVFLVAAVLAGVTPIPASAVEWLKGNGQCCDNVCRAGGGKALISGFHNNSRNAFFVCSADVRGEGARPGFNLKPNWANGCWVAHGGQEMRMPNYTCACE